MTFYTDAADAATKRLFGPFVTSFNRTEEMVSEVLDLSPRDAFAVVAYTWPSCDDTWEFRHWIAAILRNSRPHIECPAPAEDERWFRELPDELTIFRGCSRPRARGLSWTLDRTVATGFAKGHRGIPVPDPVIATCRLRKDAILLATRAREEAEVVVDFQRLPRLVVTPA